MLTYFLDSSTFTRSSLEFQLDPSIYPSELKKKISYFAKLIDSEFQLG